MYGVVVVVVVLLDCLLLIACLLPFRSNAARPHLAFGANTSFKEELI